MIQIISNKFRNLNSIALEHYQNLLPYINLNIGALRNRQKEFITKHLKEILTNKPSQLFDINEEYMRYCTYKGRHALLKKNVNKGLSKTLNYRWFSSKTAQHYCAYDLAKKIDLKTCPYCNRNYTVTIADGRNRTIRPDFDHFYPKSHYPLLSLSFYNLIPCCLPCNRTIKNQNKVKKGDYIHPYEEGFGKAFKFNFFPKDSDSALGLKNNISVIPLQNPLEPVKAQKCINSFKLFKLKELYEESHNSEIAEIIKKHHITNGKYLEILHSAFPQLGTIDELYNFAFGNFFAEHDFEKRPLSKMTKDIVEQLVFTNP